MTMRENDMTYNDNMVKSKGDTSAPLDAPKRVRMSGKPGFRKVLGVGILVMVAVLALLVYGIFFNDRARPVGRDELPRESLAFLDSYYPEARLALARVETDWFEKEYEVILADGVRVTFSRKGEWKEVKSKAAGVPMSLVPDPIREYIQKTYPGERVIEISRDRREIEVELGNRIELTFDTKTFYLTDWDD